MSYKKFMYRCLVGALALFGSASCSEDKVVSLPEDDSTLLPFGGSYPVIRQGHSFTLGCPLELSEHARDISVEWNTGSGTFIPEESRQNGMSYITGVWNESGTVEVTCRVSYTYGDERKTLERKQTCGVLPPLYGECCFLDTKEEVLQRFPDAVADDDDKLVRTNPDGSTDSFSFADGRLRYVTNDSQRPVTTESYDYFVNAFEQVQYEGSEWKSWKLVQHRFGFLPDEDDKKLKAIIGKTENGESLTDEEITFVNELFMTGIVGYEGSVGKTCAERKYVRLYSYRVFMEAPLWITQYYFEEPYIEPFNR